MSVLKNNLTESKTTPPPSEPSTIKWMGIVFLIVVLIVGGALWMRWRGDESSKKINTAAKQEDVRALVARVGTHLPVNENETPLVAIVTDVDAAKEQSPVFYKLAQNGDRLLVWSDKAILYSPSLDEVESVLVFQATPPPSAAALAAEQATVEIRNGSGVAGLSAPLAEKLRTQGLNVIKTTTTRVKEVYPKTLVMNAGSRTLPASAQILAEYGLAVSSSTVPGEAPIAADFLIILGQNDITKYQQ